MSNSGSYPSFYLPVAPAISGAIIGTLASALGSIQLGNANLYFVPIIIDRPITLTALSINVMTAGTAGSVFRLGIYTDNNGSPSNLIIDAGTVDTSSTGLKSASVSQTLTPGRYWFAGAQQGAPTTTATVTFVTSPVGQFSATTSPTSISAGYYLPNQTGALPTSVIVSASNVVSQTARILGTVG